MHEGGIAHRLVDEALARAAGRPLHRVLVEVGPGADLHPEVLAVHLEAAFLEHGVDDVVIDTRPATERCRCSCGRILETQRSTLRCPDCGGMDCSPLPPATGIVLHVVVPDDAPVVSPAV